MKLLVAVISLALSVAINAEEAKSIKYGTANGSQAAFTLYGTRTLTAPTINALSVTTLAQAGRLKISGSSFGASQGSGIVTIGGATAPVSKWTDASITAYVPDSSPLGSEPVQVITSGGMSNTLPLTVTARSAAGHVQWRFQADGLYIQGRAGIGPDGTIYALDVGGHLYALTPSGGVKWIFNTGPVAIQSVEVGPDGTIYFASSVNKIYAVTPDGTLKWTITDPSGAQVGAGPDVGPDGKIYAVTEDAGLANGLGEMTISRAGQVLANRPNYLTGRGAELRTREIVFGPTNQFYFDMNNLDNNNGLQFFRLGGTFLFARLGGGTDDQPAVGPDGNIYSTIASNQLGVFDSSGNLLRSSFFSTLTAPNVGSDGTIYVGENFPTNVLALNPDLSVKWQLSNSIGTLVGPVVDSSNTLVVVGASGIGVPSAVQGIDAASGILSWQVDLPAENGGFVRPMSRPRFSLDAATVYVGMDVNDNAADPYCYLYAIDTAVDGGGIPCEDLVSFQARCQSNGSAHKLQAKLTLTNTSHSGEQVTITVDGNPNPVTINGNKAQLSINNPALGQHTIVLTDPAGCFPPSMPSCQ
jgi:PQQ-like domain/IPT/TIG domain